MECQPIGIDRAISERCRSENVIGRFAEIVLRARIQANIFECGHIEGER